MSSIPIEWWPMAALLGAILGSFASAVGHRLPAGAPFLSARSACPSCQAVLTPRDLVPLLSWIASGGRCRHCGAKVSARYPALEVAGALAFAAAVLFPRPWEQSLALAAILTLLLALAAADLEFGLLPFALTIPLAACCLVLGLLSPTPIATVLAGGVGAILFGLALRWGFRRLRGRDGLGLGDVWFLGAVGMALPPEAWAVFLVLSGVLGVAFGLAWSRLVGPGSFPFGPALAAALAACLILPPELVMLA